MPVSIRCRCSTGCCRSTSRCCANWPTAAPNGCRSTSHAWCSTSISSAQQALHYAYTEIAKAVPQLKIMLATYFGGLGGNRDTALALPVAGLHLDLVRAPEQIDGLADFPKDRVLSLGIIDGRNIWRADLSRILDRLEPVIAKLGKERVQIAPSCSLLHVPIDLALETGLDSEIKSWLAFSVQKLEELATLGTALAGGRGSVEAALKVSDQAAAARKASPRIHDAKVAARIAGIDDAMRRRASVFTERAGVQHERFNLPAFPTTTIGSFPQTAEVRKARAAHANGALTDEVYKVYLQDQTARAVQWQETIGLDVLVHGEFERNDMVQYFGEQLAGFAFTTHGWVQSYGSRYVRPPVLFGDVSRPKPMTVEWWQYAQSLTKKPMKAMLTGPVTILNWSFVRDDIAAQRGLPADRARDPRRGRRSRGRRRRHDPDRRGGAAGGPAAAQIRMEGLSRLGRRGLPPLFVRRARRDPDPHPHVLLGVQRHHRRDRRDGCRRDLDRDLALEDGVARRVQGLPLSERNRPRRLRHPFAAGARDRRDDRPAQAGAKAALRRPDLDQSGLRIEDPQMGRGAARARQHGRGGPRVAGIWRNETCVGWAKARKRRAHHLSEIVSVNGGHAALCPPYICRDYLYDLRGRSKETAMRFWIECTGFETGQPIHINIALVGSMSRDGERTVLTYVGDGQTIDVTETPEQILERHFGADGKGVTRVR